MSILQVKKYYLLIKVELSNRLSLFILLLEKHFKKTLTIVKQILKPAAKQKSKSNEDIFPKELQNKEINIHGFQLLALLP